MAAILLLLENRGNQRLLAETLSPRHQVIPAADPSPALATVDLVIVDGPAVDRHGESLRQWKNQQLEVYLPVLLVTARHDVGLATRALWKYVDELILTPIEKVELHARVESLLNQRRLSLDLNRSFTRYAPLAFLALDKTNKVCLWNLAAERLFGWSAQEVLGQPPPIVPTSEQAVFSELLRRVMRGETFQEFELHLQKRNGEIVEGIASAGPVHNSGREVVHAVLSFLELTALRKAEAEKKKMAGELLQAQKMEAVGRLAAGVAHDFNNMLSVIITTSEMAMDNLPENDPLRTDLLEIYNAARRSAEMTSRLLAFARKQVIQPKPVDLNAAIQSALKMLRRLVGEEIQIIWEPTSSLWPIFMDPSQLDQILMNLAVNARDAIQTVGRITISTENFVADDAFCATHPDAQPGEYVQLSFADNGCGMPPEVKERIFEPFFTTKALGKGTGMGLATVFGIVKQHQGIISVYSEPGLGTVFRFYFPRHRQENAADTTPAQVLCKGGNETILVVEDEASLLKLTRAILQRLGYNVLGASGPQEALRLSAEHQGDIHLVISDVVLPESTALEMVHQIQRHRPGIRCLYMSGHTADILLQRGMQEQNALFLQKPFTAQMLAAKVREALSQ